MATYDTTNTTSDAEKKVHAAGYVLYFIGVINLLLVLASTAFDWGYFPGTAMVVGIAEAVLYLVLGYLVHKRHSATALGVGIFLVLLAGAIQIYGVVVGNIPFTSIISGMVLRILLLIVLIRAMPGAQALGPEA